jgi:hypothetical protein
LRNVIVRPETILSVILTGVVLLTVEIEGIVSMITDAKMTIERAIEEISKSLRSEMIFGAEMIVDKAGVAVNRITIQTEIVTSGNIADTVNENVRDLGIDLVRDSNRQRPIRFATPTEIQPPGVRRRPKSEIEVSVSTIATATMIELSTLEDGDAIV